MARSWDLYPRSGPRRKNADGIAARKKSGAIGDTWWSKRFVAVLEAITGGSRLQRGKSYARSGQVSHLEVGPGVISARVQGSRARPYQVKIALPVLTGRQWSAVEAALAAQALYAAALLGGELPLEIEEVFGSVGVPLFPTRGELETTCSCPDWANPCKHVAATYYMLAERFDDDPFAILAWRGRDRDELIRSLRSRRTAGEQRSPAPAPEPASPRDFWRASAESLTLRFRPEEDAASDTLLRELGPLSSGGRDWTAALAESYAVIARTARERALTAEEPGGTGEEGLVEAVRDLERRLRAGERGDAWVAAVHGLVERVGAAGDDALLPVELLLELAREARSAGVRMLRLDYERLLPPWSAALARRLDPPAYAEALVAALGTQGARHVPRLVELAVAQASPAHADAARARRRSAGGPRSERRGGPPIMGR